MQSKYYPIYDYLSKRMLGVGVESERYNELRMMNDFLINLEKAELIETKQLVENALPFDRSSEYKGYKMKIEETKPEEKPQFDDSQLLIGRNTYNPFNNEWKEIPEEKPDHDKAIEIAEVPSFFSSELSKEHNEWNHKVRDTLNLIIKKINNL